MQGFHLLGLIVAFLFTFAAALPTDAGGAAGIFERSPAKKTKGTKTRKVKPYPPSYTSPAPVVTCPSTPYYIQDAGGSYLQANLDSGYLPATTFDLYSLGASTAEAAVFTFVQNGDGTCQLSLYPTNILPSNIGFRSIIYAVPPLSPTIQYIMHIQGAIDGNFPPAEVYCQTDASLSLNCGTTAGGAPEQLFKTGGQLAISPYAQSGPSGFQLIPVL